MDAYITVQKHMGSVAIIQLLHKLLQHTKMTCCILQTAFWLSCTHGDNKVGTSSVI